MALLVGGVACAPALHPPNRFGGGRCGERLPRPVACFAWPCFGGVRGSCDSELLIGLIKIERTSTREKKMELPRTRTPTKNPEK